MLLSNKIKFLSLFCAFGICTNLANATETVTFHFYYESGINDVGYAYNGNHDSSNMQTPQVNKSDGQTSVSVTAKMDDEKSIANSFIDKLGSSTRMVGLDTTDSEPNQLDFWIDGALSINGETVSSDFYLARIPDHWWLGSTTGTAYIFSDTNPQTNRGIVVYGSNSGKPYCLMENGQAYYNVNVFSGTCGNAINQETESEELVLKWGEGVSSLSFEPLSSPESGQIASITSTSNGNSQTIIKITATPLDSSSVANSFNSLMTENENCWQQGSAIYDFELHVQGLVCGPSPQYLDFYVSGYMLINGQYVVVKSSNGKKRQFVLAYGQGRWWLGTTGAAFEDYGGGGPGYDNHATVDIPKDQQKNTYAGYHLEAISNNSFKVHASDDN